MNRDGKDENPASIRCLTMLLRCLQDSSTVALRLMPAALRFTPMELRMLKNAHDAARFDTVLLRFKPVAPRQRQDLLRMCTIWQFLCDR